MDRKKTVLYIKVKELQQSLVPRDTKTKNIDTTVTESQKMLSRKTLIDYIDIRSHNNQFFCRRHLNEFIMWNTRLFQHPVQS